DDNGRIVLGQALRETSGITDTALFVGMTDRFQIWDPAAYAKDQENLRDWANGEDQDDDLFAMLHEVQAQYAQ
ncbi:MAG: division/cell wall cluster transcriptional repressor MraZ, partial [Pseudomonadota bacterium]